MFYLIGASGHAKVILEILELNALPIGGVIDQNPLINKLLDYNVTSDLPINYNKTTDKFLISIGQNLIRKNLSEQHYLPYGVAIHPKTNVSHRCKVGEGSVIMAGVSINADVEILNHCILNTNASIDHDCTIESFTHISPNVALAGNVFVGEGTHIGIGASIIQGVKIGKWVTVGAGAVVLHDVPDYAVVVGIPARVIKFNLPYGK